MLKLKSTNEQCFVIPSAATGAPAWKNDYRRVCIIRPTGNVIQIVHMSKLVDPVK